ncbi:MAG TPA: NDP-sugar synthase [Pyrinomonadaceae bacterium]|nr:NDP-sugar synthase [Acidobacteriota bacterium]HQZ97403.1 NDP-sugar synthase [Pyrinomonadaceae bacterium]
MQALILAGGKGIRLRPLTVYTPKPIVPVVNRPFLLYQIDILREAGVTDITLSLSYQPDKIEHVLGNGSEFGVNLRYITEANPMGTGGAYKLAAESLRETTIVLNGDILTDLKVSEVVKFHQANEAAATLTLVPVTDVSRFGVSEVDNYGRIVRFVEKPQGEELADLKTNTINAGVYILEPSILDLIAKDANRSFEYDVFPDILSRGLPFFGYVMEDSYWLDIGTPENYLRAHHDFLSGKIKGIERPESAYSDVTTKADIDKRSVLGEGCTVKPGARILNSVIGPGVYIEEKAVIENSVLWSHTKVSTAAEIRDSIIGRSCHIGRNVTVGEGSVIGDKTTLTDYTRV